MRTPAATFGQMGERLGNELGQKEAARLIAEGRKQFARIVPHEPLVKFGRDKRRVTAESARHDYIAAICSACGRQVLVRVGSIEQIYKQCAECFLGIKHADLPGSKS